MSKQNTVARLKSSDLPPLQKFWPVYATVHWLVEEILVHF